MAENIETSKHEFGSGVIREPATKLYNTLIAIFREAGPSCGIAIANGSVIAVEAIFEIQTNQEMRHRGISTSGVKQKQ